MADHVPISFLHKLHNGFLDFLEEIKPQGRLDFIKEFEADPFNKFRRKFDQGIARLLMGCREYVGLPYLDKVRPIQGVVNF